MKTQNYEGIKEISVLAAMTYDPAVLGKIAGWWTKEEKPFASPPANIVAGWLVKYWERHARAPKKSIVSLALAWAEKNPTHSHQPLVDKIVSAVVDHHDTNGSPAADYSIDQAGEYFSTVKARRAVESAQGHLDAGRVGDALASLAAAEKVALDSKGGTHLFQDKDAVKSAFTIKGESLIEFRSEAEAGLREFFGDALQRDVLLGVIAPEGVGKTWWLVDLAYRAMLNRRRVAFFEVGDMTQPQIIRRLLVRAAGRPWGSGTIQYPTSVEAFNAVREGKTYGKPLTFQEAWEACERVMRERVRAKRSYFYLETHANSSVTVAGIRASLDSLSRGGWVPDLVLIDYADILADPPGRRDERAAINENWKQLRRLSQELHCLCVTATQARRDSYDGHLLRKKHMADDKRKLAHASHFVGINQTTEDKKQGMYRLNWLKARDMDFHEERCVHTAGCLAVGNPAVLSVYPRGDQLKAGREKRKAASGSDD